MDIVLVSEDRELYRVCLEILDEILSQPWTLSAAGASDVISHADLCIWDYQSDGALPNCGHGFSSKHLYLVSRKDLPGFRRVVAFPAAAAASEPIVHTLLASLLGPRFWIPAYVALLVGLYAPGLYGSESP